MPSTGVYGSQSNRSIRETPVLQCATAPPPIHTICINSKWCKLYSQNCEKHGDQNKYELNSKTKVAVAEYISL